MSDQPVIRYHASEEGPLKCGTYVTASAFDAQAKECERLREALEYVEKGATLHRFMGAITIPSIALDKVIEALHGEQG